MMNQPNLSMILEGWWGGSYVDYSIPIIIQTASNIFVGGNPAYGPNEFFALCPKFASDPINGLSGGLVAASANVMNVVDVGALDELEIGQYISDIPRGGILPATTVVAINMVTSVITLSNPAALNLANDPLQVYPSPIVPMPVLLTYISLAQACVQYNRWLESWPIGMMLYIAHFLTLYLWSEGAPSSPPGAAASAGLARGILTSKSAGDVSAGYSQIMSSGWESWGAWNLTLYGQQFITMAKVIGFGPMYIW